MEKLTHESQFMGGILHEFAICDEKGRLIKNPDDCFNLASEYLNILDKLCYFDVKGYLSDDVMDFFKNYMRWGLGYFNWLKDIGLSDSDLEEAYPSVIKSCKNHNTIPLTLLGELFEAHREKMKKRKESNPS